MEDLKQYGNDNNIDWSPFKWRERVKRLSLSCNNFKSPSVNGSKNLLLTSNSMKTRCGLLSLSRFLPTTLLVVLTWPFSICPIQRYDGHPAELKASTFWKTITRPIIYWTNCENRFNCLQKQDCPVSLLFLLRYRSTSKAAREFLHFLSKFHALNLKTLGSLSTNSYNNNVQNANNQVWRF